MLESLIAAGALLAVPVDSGLVVTAVRFYRADPGQSPGTTQVTAMIRIPAGLAEAGTAGEVSLGFRVRVVGPDGPLYEQSWQKRTALPFPRGDADRLDVLRFTLTSGSYHLEAVVTDSVSGREARATVPIEAYRAPPIVSDLLLSTSLRPVAAADTIPQPGEFRRGGLILAIAPTVTVAGRATATLAYMLETYSGIPLDASLTLTVVDASGAVVRRTDPTPIRVIAGIGVLTGQVETGELHAGSFRLVATIVMGDRTVERDAWFTVDPSIRSAPASQTDAAFFGGLAGDELDRAFAPLGIIAAPGELAGWSEEAADSVKREFLTRFWRSRDPTPSTGNERRAQFYDGVAYVNAFYGSYRQRLMGWQTDRGRIFLREGLPAQIVRRKPRGNIPAYEVWRYFEGEGRYYLFANRGQAGVVLIRSNDHREHDDRRWQDILTPGGVREAVGLLGRAVVAER
jgi:GWxTD domain-containing protein